ncbi:MAG TPA: dTDP-4-dehydrorhamnose reductase [Chitinophagaceae bacterium]|nr:dTDP-4-dehydrorhamnose reductase [Chitinophagaceae bacterium]
MIRPKILVTGANGQLGKELQEVCSAWPDYEFVFLPRQDLPLENFELVRATFGIQQPQFCINCAAYTAVDQAESEKELAFQINGESVGVLAAVCREHDCRFIHVSTDYVFDGKSSRPYQETDFTNPLNVYGASKLEGENQAFQFNIDSVVIRSSWVYSPFGKNFVKTMMRLMRERDQVQVVNDQTGSPTYAADLAAAIMDIISFAAWRPGLYHFSNSGEITWFDFALGIRQITGASCEIEPIASSRYPTTAMRPRYSVLDKTRIRETFGIALRDWKESLLACIQRIGRDH